MEVIEFIKDNSEWIVPIAVAIIAGVFTLFTKSESKNNQSIKNVNDSFIQQAGESINNNTKEK